MQITLYLSWGIIIVKSSPEFENTVILSGVHNCTLMDLDLFLYIIFKLSNFEEINFQNSI